MTSFTDRILETTAGRLFARLWGEPQRDAPTLLLFHDSLGCVELWRDFPARLAATTGRAVVAYDRLGFGRSDPHPGCLTPDFMREEARTSVPALISQLGLGALVPLGHSVGGAMAVATAAHFPEDCAAVITESAQAFVEDRTVAGIRAAQAGFTAPGQVERLARYHGDKARWVLDAWIETWLSPGFATWRLDDDLRGLRCPVLALHGDNDEYGSPAHPERIRSVPAGPAHAILLEGVGHVPHREHPEVVLAHVAAFLRGLPPRSAARERPAATITPEADGIPAAGASR
ncbi:alpha/beta hydrolase [Cystobacter fuscus]|uniref:Alpha/beta hydrolase n=1 Tax=Cystobacter fuscus TaxID=43 RepID=A0A250IY47_9BACT|nr:alpha/beta hydrolase [Cystobacter fuscus]ATB36137.1 alpha/beta hydrolase [Cystobacter fuscus]